MYRKLEQLGTGLLGLFVPKVEASASAASCAWKSFSSCFECGGRPCTSYCCTGLGCDHTSSRCG